MIKIVIASILLGLASIAVAQTAVGLANVVGTGNDSGVTGTVVFSVNATNSSLIDVKVYLSGITVNATGSHGIHVHTWGDLSQQTNSSSTGTHWLDATHATHGCYETNGDNRHLGDMGNWDAVSGVINQTKTFDLLALNGDNSIIGRAVVLHSGTDECIPAGGTGNSGSRLAHGVIGIPQITGQTNNAAPKSNSAASNASAICILKPFPGYTVSGYGYLNQVGTTGDITVVLSGVSGNTVHAVHIHQYGDLTTNTSAGVHWDVGGNNHSVWNYSSHHTGDLGNIFTFNPNDNTVSYYNGTGNKSFSLIGSSTGTAIPNPIGLTLIIHALRDQCNGTNGFSGDRIAGCVFGWSSNTLTDFNPALPSINVPNFDATTIAACNVAHPSTTGTTTATVTTGSNSTTGTTAQLTTTTGSTSTGGAASSPASIVSISSVFVAVLALFAL